MSKNLFYASRGVVKRVINSVVKAALNGVIIYSGATFLVVGIGALLSNEKITQDTIDKLSFWIAVGGGLIKARSILLGGTQKSGQNISPVPSPANDLLQKVSSFASIIGICTAYSLSGQFMSRLVDNGFPPFAALSVSLSVLSVFSHGLKTLLDEPIRDVSQRKSQLLSYKSSTQPSFFKSTTITSSAVIPPARPNRHVPLKQQRI
ncbi:hypothetical protein BH10PSE19_BH10PSE19_04700 [soil metagenome]